MKSATREGQESPNVGLHYMQEVIQHAVHHFYITGEISFAHNYIEMIHIIRSASPNDVIYLHLNTTGGHLDTGIQLINAMNESSAHIVCSIEAQAFSLGSMIFLAADEFIVHDNAMLMIHNFNSGMAGKGNEQRLRLDAITTMFDDFVRPIYVPFISDAEFDNVLEGKDIWLHSSEIRERIVAAIELKEAAKNPPPAKTVVKKKPVKKKPVKKRVPAK